MATFNVTLHQLLPSNVFRSLLAQAPLFLKLGLLQMQNQNAYVRWPPLPPQYLALSLCSSPQPLLVTLA